MAKKKRIAVKKRARRREEPAPAQEARSPEPMAKGAPVMMIDPDAPGIRPDIIEELDDTKPWLKFAMGLTHLAALAIAIWAGMIAVSFFRGGGEAAGDGAVSSDTFGFIFQIAALLIMLAIFEALAIRMSRFNQWVDRAKRSNQEEELEYVLIYLKGFWNLLGGGILSLIVLSGILYWMMG